MCEEKCTPDQWISEYPFKLRKTHNFIIQTKSGVK